MPVINMEIPEVTKQRLAAEAARDDRSQASVIRLAIDHYLTERECLSGAGGSVVEEAPVSTPSEATE